MTLEQYIELNLKKGTIHLFHWIRPLKNNEVYKEFRNRVKKETICSFRVGVTYENMAINKDKETGSLPYGFFEYSNEIIYSPSTNTHQVRLTKTMNENIKPMVKWYLDDKEITKEELIEMNALSATTLKSSSNNNPVFNLKLDYIVEIK